MNTCRFCHKFTVREFCDEKCYQEYQQTINELNKLQCERCTEFYLESNSSQSTRFCSKDCEEDHKERIKLQKNEDLSDWDYSMNF